MVFTLIQAVIVGLLIGMVVGALGAGGGILSVPVLVYLLGFAPRDAMAASLIVVGMTAAVSLINAARDRRVMWRDGAVFGLVSIVGSYCGGIVQNMIPETILLSLFCIMLVVVGVVMVRKGLRARRRGDDDRSEVMGERRGLPTVALAASLTGFLTGFFGVGGGFIVVPMLVLALGFPMRRASGTSLLVMVMAASAGLAARLGQPIHLNLPVVVAFGGASMLGGILGGPLTRPVPSWLLTVVFGVLLLGVSAATAVGLAG